MTSLRLNLRLLAAPLLAVMLASGAQAGEKHHALALVGTPKYGPDFKHFDYVNPDAPKGGDVRRVAIGTFDSLNTIPYKGNVVDGLGLIYETLMTGSMDEISSEYGLLAEWISYPDDFSSATFKLRDEARWHDGKAVTPEDVIFSLSVQKEYDPRIAFYYKNVSKAEKTGENQVTFYFNEKNNRELPQIVGQLAVFPKHFYEANPKAKPGNTWLELPLGSGPYRIKSFDTGRNIVYERVTDYWGERLPINVGQNNLDEIRYEYFRDTIPAFEAFKAGKIDFYAENSAKNWATSYNFPALNSGKIVKNGDIHLKNPEPMQAFILNLRRDKFKDRRVRQAFNLMFNFEWMNKNVFYGQYKRTSSFFENTELAATGLPTGKELEILETVRNDIPPEVFTTVYKNPTNTEQSIVDRQNQREAIKLLREAGWQIENNALKNQQTGAALNVEFCLNSPLFERVVAPYKQALERIGIKSTIRIVDAAQYKRRVDSFDFDIIVGGWGQSESPGNEQRDYWGSEAANRPGSRNWAGIQNPAIDKLVDRVIFTKDREELVAASRALDRVLLWNYYVVPQYYAPNERIAYWNKYSHPASLPSRSVGFPTIWWYDKEKAAKLASN